MLWQRVCMSSGLPWQTTCCSRYSLVLFFVVWTARHETLDLASAFLGLSRVSSPQPMFDLLGTSLDHRQG